MAAWAVTVTPMPGPVRIDVSWPSADPLAPPLTATIQMLDGDQARFVAGAIANLLGQLYGPAQ